MSSVDIAEVTALVRRTISTLSLPPSLSTFRPLHEKEDMPFNIVHKTHCRAGSVGCCTRAHAYVNAGVIAHLGEGSVRPCRP